MGVNTSRLSQPVRLADGHTYDDFSCGDLGVDSWLRERATKAERSGSARTFVVCDGSRVVAFYCLSNAIFSREELASAKQRRGVPSEVPAVLIGQLGVDRRYQRQKLGQHLLRDAMGRALHLSEHSGVVVMHLHASTEEARAFYLHLDLGFVVSRSEPLTLYLPLETIRNAVLPE